jgi:thiol-disulfide isomerase/thioredoxin
LKRNGRTKTEQRAWNLIAFAILALAWSVTTSRAVAADNLKLNAHLEYQSDSADGPLITGDHMSAGQAANKVNYVIIYAEGCYNSKRQARRTVNLYQKYRDRVNFVVVDLDQHASVAQAPLVAKYYKGYIPTVVILDTKGAVLYDRAGEEDENSLAELLDKALE